MADGERGESGCGKEGVGAYCLSAIGVWLLIVLLKRDKGLRPREILEALKNGARGVFSMAVACAMAGMIVGAIMVWQKMRVRKRGPAAA